MFKQGLTFLLVGIALVGCLSASWSGQPPLDEKTVSSQQGGSKPSTFSSKALYEFARARLLALANRLPEAEEALRKAIHYDPRSAYLRMMMAEIMLARGDQKQAEKSLGDALVQDPDYVDAHLLLGNLLYNRQAFSEAIVHLNRVLALDPSLEKVYLQLTAAHVRLEDSEGAIRVLKEMLQKNPDSVAGGLALSRLYRQLGLTSMAERTYREFLQRHPQEVQGYVELARIFQDLGQKEQALAVLKQGMAANPSADDFRYQLVRVLVESGQPDQALDILHAMLREQPDRLEARRMLGLLLMEKKAWKEAGEAFELLLAAEPMHEQGLFYLGVVRENQEQWSDAIAAFLRLPPESEFFLDATSHLGYLYYRDGQSDKAIRLLEDRLRDNDGTPQLYTFLISLYHERGDDTSAGPWLKRGMEKFPDSAELHYQRGLLLEKQDNRKGAIQDMRRAIELDHKHYEAMNFIAYSFAEQGENLEEALTLARKALDLNNEAHIIDTLGWVLFKMGRFSEARRELEAAAALLPEDALVLEHLADLYGAMEIWEKAAAVYERAWKLRPDDGDLEKKLRGAQSHL